MKVCKVEGCNNVPSGGRGYCKPHYDKLVHREDIPPTPICTVEGCNKDIFTRTLCFKHYREKYGKKEKKKLTNLGEL